MITQEVLSFLQLLESNNNRDWFQEHKSEFKVVEKIVKDHFQLLFDSLKQHDDVDAIKIFRIYRDVRFSKNKQPYKTHFGGTFHRVKPQFRGGYYLQIKPNNKSFSATGFWDPNKEDLLRIRKEIEIDASELRDILNENALKSVWGDLQGEELKTAPKGFDRNHPDIDLIKKKQFIFTKSYTDAEVLSSDFISKVTVDFKAIKPYFDYMSDVLTTNINGESLL